MYLLLELQYAISFCTRTRRAERSETALSYFSFLQHFSFSVLPPTFFEKKRKLLSLTAVDIGGELELQALCFRGCSASRRRGHRPEPPNVLFLEQDITTPMAFSCERVCVCACTLSSLLCLLCPILVEKKKKASCSPHLANIHIHQRVIRGSKRLRLNLPAYVQDKRDGKFDR